MLGPIQADMVGIGVNERRAGCYMTDVFDDSFLRADHVSILELVLCEVNLRNWLLLLYLHYSLLNLLRS